MLRRTIVLVCVLVSALAISHFANAHSLPSWWVRQALCVHRYEGSWTDPGAPFYGGMQFDYSTWLANGGGRYAQTANLATPHEQLHIAYVTWKQRGWYPWPTTARLCGLL